jgi:hypothetical protein
LLAGEKREKKRGEREEKREKEARSQRCGGTDVDGACLLG